ncbi:hypothetical protein P171DRAFT_453274 [Karstenula rhodostoma CBS 690.94]|uniref:Transcription factor domain-containing protein n=1 Tax=Karstenula rhodostoma CBS 690.94 TaxID=1392251 RepID=A0A9P4PME5_9PLEO|nr:hypothetical protein P171DRAFT_453274 [Karstenula rhodostoma CBS 690.94]
MLTDDLFKGWLSVPEIDGFLDTEAPNQQEKASVPSCPAGNNTQRSLRGENGLNSTERLSRQLDRPRLGKFDDSCLHLPQVGPSPSDTTCAEPDIPRFSHQYEYLMHGMLAIAGSHLDLFSDDPRSDIALLHRQKAIVGLEEAFTRWPPCADEAHVMLATSYLLAFQSSYLPDGLLDHILSLRGCALLSQLILTDQIKGVFTIDPGIAPIIARLAEILRPLLVSTGLQGPPENARPAVPEYTEPTQPSTANQEKHPSVSFPDAATNPLFPAKLAPNFEDITSWETITEVPVNQQPDLRRSFQAFMLSLAILTTWPREQVLALFSPKNSLGSVLVAHFCCVRFITSPFWAPDSALRTTPMRAIVEWCEKAVDAVADDEEVEWTKFVRWPRKILTTMRCLLGQSSGLTLGQLHDALCKDAAAFREGRPVRLEGV